MINVSAFEDPTSSRYAAERADLMEACLRGELSKEEYETLLSIMNKRLQKDEDRK